MILIVGAFLTLMVIFHLTKGIITSIYLDNSGYPVFCLDRIFTKIYCGFSEVHEGFG